MFKPFFYSTILQKLGQGCNLAAPFRPQSKSLLGAGILALGLIFATPNLATAQSSNQWPGGRVGGGTRGPSASASDEQWPGSRVGGGTRGALCIKLPEEFEQFSPSQKLAFQEDLRSKLVALTPNSNLARTIESYPTLFWYLPPTDARYLEFSLYQIDDSQALLANDRLIYQTTFRITGESGIASLKIPDQAGVPPLEEGDYYAWSLSLVCNTNDATTKPEAENTNISLELQPENAHLSISGFIQRIEPDPALIGQVNLADPANQTFLYVQDGLWLDALASVTHLACEPDQSNESSPSFEEQWQKVLGLLDLQALADRKILSECQSCDQPQNNSQGESQSSPSS